jgi:TonB family protein
MPWNPVVWWQLKRLRAAIEVDCDARVLKSGADRVSYSEALLWVRQRSGGLPFGAIALTEPVSDLERRIRIMLDKARKFSASRTGLRSAIAMSLVAIALSVEAPLAQQANDGALPPAQAGKVIPTIRTAVYDLLSQAQLCMDREDFVCAGAYLDQALQMDLNGYEKAQYWNFTAFIAFEQNDSNGAITAFENVLADPAAIPDGMRDTAIRSLGALYASTEQYEKAFNRLNELLELNGISPAFKVGFGVPDGEYLPIVKVAPTYPKRAAAEGLDGYVIVQYTVTKSGATSEVVIIESSNTVFEQAAVESARKYKYKPRVVDGQPVAVPGVTTKMIFEANPAQSVSIEP